MSESRLYNFPGGPYNERGSSKNNGGGGSGMEERLTQLERSVSQIQADISAIKAEANHYATKADLAQVESSLIKWIVGTMLASAGLAATIAFGLAKLLGH